VRFNYSEYQFILKTYYVIDDVETLERAIKAYKPLMIKLVIDDVVDKFFVVLYTGKLIRLVSNMFRKDKLHDVEEIILRNSYIPVAEDIERLNYRHFIHKFYITMTDRLLDVLLEVLKYTFEKGGNHG